MSNKMIRLLDESKSFIIEIENAKEIYERHAGVIPNKIYMCSYLYGKLFDISIKVRGKSVETISGMSVEIDNDLRSDRIALDYVEENDHVVKPWCKVSANNDLPVRYIINKGATILFWADGTKTIVKRDKDDEYDKVKGFLWAYFQKHSGLSKTKANKYLAGLQDKDDIEFNKVLEKGTDYGTILSNAFKELFK